MNYLREQIIPVIGFLLVLLGQVTYQLIGESATTIEIIKSGAFFIALYAILLTVYTWFYAKPHAIIQNQKGEYNEFLAKIEASVNKLVQKQRFIDQATLDIIEKQAKNIWVVTVRLSSELENKNLQKSVEENLENGKNYIYFLPHEDDKYFLEVNRNLKRFKELDLYKKHKSNIQFIRLPQNTQFLLEEVVIYNPTESESSESDTEGLNAFTFYESKEEDQDSLHMKIEGNMLKHVRDQLEQYLEDRGLKFAADQILTEYASKLEDKDKLYIANLMIQTKITNKEEYKNFIDNLNREKISETDLSFISSILNKHFDFK